ncbi:hypothetical protein Tco_1335827 [Tanacetum coccineum]
MHIPQAIFIFSLSSLYPFSSFNLLAVVTCNLTALTFNTNNNNFCTNSTNLTVVTSRRLLIPTKAEEEKEIPSHTKGEQEDVVIKEPKEAKVTKEEPRVYLDKKEQMERAMKEAKLGEPMIKKVAAEIVLTRAHNEKLKQIAELKKKRFDQKLPEGVPFEKNLVIAQPEHGIFFIDTFGEPAF